MGKPATEPGLPLEPFEAVPGGTVERVENHAEGSPYEAHMTKADGSHATVKVDAGFNGTGIEEGHGR